MRSVPGAMSGPILLAYDGSDSAKAAIERAGRLFPGRRALVLYVWQPVGSVLAASLAGMPAEYRREALAEVNVQENADASQLAEAGAARARDAGLDADPLTAAAEDSIWSTILAVAAREGADAVVVGSRGRSKVASALLGGVSTGVLHHACLPVVLVQADRL
jgi:nucleotide-binding universal stress UspA family protein